MQSKIPSLRVNTDKHTTHASPDRTQGKARDLIMGNRLSLSQTTKTYTRHSSTPTSTLSASPRRPTQGNVNSGLGPAMQFKNTQTANAYKTSPYIKGNLANTRQSIAQHSVAPKSPMPISRPLQSRSRSQTQTLPGHKKNPSQMRTSISAKSPHIPGPPLRRLPTASKPPPPATPAQPSSKTPKSLTTESLGKKRHTVPSTPVQSHIKGYAVGLHSDTSTKLNALLQKDIEDLDKEIFSLLGKHEAQHQQKERDNLVNASPAQPSAILHEPSRKIAVSKSESSSESSKMVKDKAGVVKHDPIKLTKQKKPSFLEKLAEKALVKSPSKAEKKKSLMLDDSPLIPIRRATPAKEEPPKQVKEQPAKQVINPSKRSTTTTDPIPSSPPPVKHKPKPLTTSSHIPEHAPPSQSQHACTHCARTFNPDRLTSHEKVCSKTLKSAKTREKRRLVGEKAKEKETAMKEKIVARENYGKVPRAKVDWRAAHDDLINNVRAAKEYQKEVLAKK